GAGILAALLFLALPFENQQAIRSVRDISPLWFATVAFGFFVCVAGNFTTRKWNYLTYLALGALSLLGVGWRSDAFLVSPVLLVRRPFWVVCWGMLRGGIEFHLFQLLSDFAGVLSPGLGRFGALSGPGCLQGEDMVLLRQSRLPWALPIYDWCLDYLIVMLPFLHIIGILILFWVGRDKIRGAFLLLFSLYYSVIWFAALPEEKHLGQMLLPLAAGGGLGL